MTVLQPDVRRPLTIEDLLTHPAIGPLENMPQRYRGPRTVAGDGWLNFVARLERGEEIALIKSLVRHNKKVLDVGGGSGEMARAVFAQLGSCTAVEPHPQLVDSMRGGGEQRDAVEVFAGVAESLPFPDGVFDAVYSAWVLPYVESIEKAVGEMARVCDRDAPHAKIVLFCAGPDNELLKLVNSAGVPVAGEDYDHHGYLLRSAAEVLSEIGFDRFELFRTEASLRFDEQSAAERSVRAAAILAEFWYGGHVRSGDIRESLEGALREHFATRPHAIGDQGTVLVATAAPS